MSIEIVADVLINCINKSFVQGIFPTDLKNSIVKPLFKKGDKQSLSNYRPITLIPIFSKIFEKLMYLRLISFIDKHQLLKDEQNGFRKDKNTSLATFNLMKLIIDSIDNKEPVTVLFLDMSKAFDCVDHNRLLTKLYRYGIRGSTYDWIKSYLCNRNQAVELINYSELSRSRVCYRTDFIHNMYGVPQGSVLGPLLFLMYINDLPDSISHDCVLFADDTTIAIRGKNLNSYEFEINDTLRRTIEWLSANNLKANVSKTKYMQFYPYQAKPQKLNVKYQGQTVQETMSSNFLGITLDSHCNWKDHISNLCSKLNRFIHALRRVSQRVSRQAAITAYNGYISSLIRYGILLWGNATDIDRVFILQKRSLRAIFMMRQIESCRRIFIDNNILTVPCLYVETVCNFVHKHRHFYSTLNVFSERLKERFQHKLYRPKTNLTIAYKSSYQMGVKIYNALPDNFKNLKMAVFRKSIKKWLIQNCFYSVNEFLNYKM